MSLPPLTGLREKVGVDGVRPWCVWLLVLGSATGQRADGRWPVMRLLHDRCNMPDERGPLVLQAMRCPLGEVRGARKNPPGVQGRLRRVTTPVAMHQVAILVHKGNNQRSVRGCGAGIS